MWMKNISINYGDEENNVDEAYERNNLNEIYV